MQIFSAFQKYKVYFSIRILSDAIALFQRVIAPFQREVHPRDFSGMGIFHPRDFSGMGIFYPRDFSGMGILFVGWDIPAKSHLVRFSR